MEKNFNSDEEFRSASSKAYVEMQSKKEKNKLFELIFIPIISIILSVITYAVVFFTTAKGSWAHQLFFERSWIQHANTFFFWLAIVALVMRWTRHRYEVKACNVIEKELIKSEYQDMSWQNAFILEERLMEEEFGKHRQNLVFTRVTRALARLTKTQSTAEMREYMRIRGEIDYEEMESSYAGIRYLTWLIPTLGFVGTVLGISEGISSCGKIVQQAMLSGGKMPDISFAIKALGTAFDTTFLALVYSAIAVFCTSFQTKEEEQVLERIDHLSIDEVCGKFQEHSTINDGLVRRLLDMEKQLIDNANGDRAALSKAIRDDLPQLLAKTLAKEVGEFFANKDKGLDALSRSLNHTGIEVVGKIEKISRSIEDGNKGLVYLLGDISKNVDNVLVHLKNLNIQNNGNSDNSVKSPVNDPSVKKPDSQSDNTPGSSNNNIGGSDGGSLSEDDIKTKPFNK